MKVMRLRAASHGLLEPHEAGEYVLHTQHTLVIDKMRNEHQRTIDELEHERRKTRALTKRMKGLDA